MSNNELKTASELALEYWNKPPIERVNNTLQNYVYDYMLSKLLEKDSDINSKEEIENND